VFHEIGTYVKKTARITGASCLVLLEEVAANPSSKYLSVISYASKPSKC